MKKLITLFLLGIFGCYNQPKTNDIHVVCFSGEKVIYEDNVSSIIEPHLGSWANRPYFVFFYANGNVAKTVSYTANCIW